jgi:hypothetical protein
MKIGITELSADPRNQTLLLAESPRAFAFLRAAAALSEPHAHGEG